MNLFKSTGKIEQKGNYYIKHFHRDFSVEKDKYTSLYELSKNSNFVFPKSIEINDDSKTIMFERLTDIESVRNAYLSCMKAKIVDPWQIKKIYQVGVALAEIHQGLSLRSYSNWVPHKTFYNAVDKNNLDDFENLLENANQCYTLGDFGFSNIFFKKGDNAVPIIFDPSFDGYTIFSTNALGPVYLDIAHFIACLDGLVPLWHYPSMHWSRLSGIKDVFLSGYEKTSGIELQRDWIARFAFATVSAKFAVKPPLLRKVGVWLVYNRLKGNMPDR